MAHIAEPSCAHSSNMSSPLGMVAVPSVPPPQATAAGATSSQRSAPRVGLPALHAAAQRGDGPAVAALLANDAAADEIALSDGSTALQWAVSSNSLIATTELLQAGANPRKRAGYMHATALHWACRNGNAYVARLLLDAGADPTAVDDAGYTPLHTAVHSSNVLLVAYMLYYLDSPPGVSSNALEMRISGGDPSSGGILAGAKSRGNRSHLTAAEQQLTASAVPAAACSHHVMQHRTLGSQGVVMHPLKSVVDARDGALRTPLHWAAYQGDYLSVRQLLAAGADPDAADHEGFTPLHWALVARSRESVVALLRSGASLWARNNEGKDAFVVTTEMNAEKELQAAFVLTNRAPDGSIKRQRMSPRTAWIVAFSWPALLLAIVLAILASSLRSAFVVPVVVLLCLIVPMLAARRLYSAWPGRNAVVRSPTLAGVFVAVLVADTVVLARQVWPATRMDHLAEALVLAVTLLASIGFYVRAMCMDPGFVPFGTAASQRQAMEELMTHGKLTASYFDVETGTRKPFRSFFSTPTTRLVARYDHYCPWLANAVGVRNHRSFVAYVSLLSVALVIAGHLLLCYWYTLDEHLWYAAKSTRAVLFLALVTLFQASWIFFLTGLQHLQIMRGMTTQEVIDQSPKTKYVREQYNSLPPDHPTATAAAAAAAEAAAKAASSTTATQTESNALTAEVGNTRTARSSRWTTCLRVLGVQQVAMSSSLLLRANKNCITDNGVWRNLRDFWTGKGSIIFPKNGWGRLNGEDVDYYEIWNVAGDPRAVAAIESMRSKSVAARASLEQLV